MYSTRDDETLKIDTSAIPTPKNHHICYNSNYNRKHVEHAWTDQHHAQRIDNMRIPTKILQLPNFVSEMISRQLTLLKAPQRPEATFHLCFFSCESYFPYLYCSIHSIKRTVKHPLRFLVFNDTDQPLSTDQAQALKQLEPNLTVIEWPKSMGWGSEQIQKEDIGIDSCNIVLW